MKKLLTMVLLTVMCIGLLMGSAQAADWLEPFIGYYELQNVAVGSFTLGASDAGFEMSAAVHDDGVIIIKMDDELIAEYINDNNRSYFIGDDEVRLDLFMDDQGRLHIKQGEGYDAIDYRLRPVEIDMVGTPMAAYLGNWKVTNEDAEKYGDISMMIFNDGFGVIYAEKRPVPVYLSMMKGEVGLVDEFGQFMPIVKEANGVISFTLVYEDGSDTLHMKRGF